MVQKITKYISNNVTILLLITAIMAMIIQMDGSGAMTMLITIPALLRICPLVWQELR